MPENAKESTGSRMWIWLFFGVVFVENCHGRQNSPDG